MPFKNFENSKMTLKMENKLDQLSPFASDWSKLMHSLV